MEKMNCVGAAFSSLMKETLGALKRVTGNLWLGCKPASVKNYLLIRPRNQSVNCFQYRTFVFNVKKVGHADCLLRVFFFDKGFPAVKKGF